MDDTFSAETDLYSTLADLSPNAVVIHRGGVIISANPLAQALLGASSAEEVIGHPILQFIHPADHAVALERVAAMQKSGEGLPATEERFVTLDGRVLYGEVAASPIRYRGEQAFLVVVRDITDRRREQEERAQRLEEAQAARAAAEEAQARLALLAEAGKVLAGSLDYETTLNTVAHLAVPALADWCIIDIVNPDGSVRRVVSAHADPEREAWAWAVEQRYPARARQVRDDVEPLLVAEITDEMLAHAARDEEHLQLLRQAGLRSSISVPLRVRDRVLGTMTLLMAESGRTYTEADVVQVGELAQRAALAVENARLYQTTMREAAERQAILGQLADGVVIADNTGTITFMNRAAVDLYGHDWTGASIYNYSPQSPLTDEHGQPYPSAASLPLHHALVKGERTIGSEARAIREDGTVAIVQRNATPVVGSDGKLIGAVLTVRDVTAERDLEHQKDEFLTLVAHELRTPITVIQAFVQLLERDLAGTDAHLRRRTQAVTRQARQLTALINDLVDLSRLQTGRFTCALDPLDYTALLRTVLDEMRDIFPDRRFRLRTVEELTITGDVVRLQQVLVNLLQNAVAYGPPGSEISVEVVTQGNTVLTSVADEGPPLPAEVREQLFDRFYRLPAHRRTQPGGMGLGLYISRAIVEAHGGAMWVPDAPYACFTFSLPFIGAATPAAAPASSVPAH